MELSKEAKISTAVTPTAGVAGTTAINGSTLDMQNYEAVLMLVRMGAITGSAVTSIKAQQGDQSDASDMSDLLGTDVTIADSDDDEVFAIDLIKPEKRYARLVVNRATQNAVVAGAEYIQTGPRKQPITQDAGVTVETHVSPIEGTA